MYEKFVGIGNALHYGFAQPPDTADQHNIAAATFGIEREDHPRTRAVGADHALHADRQGDGMMRKAFVDPVRYRALTEQRGETIPDRLYQILGAAHIEETFMHARERSRWRVLRRRTAAHRNRDTAPEIALQAAIGNLDIGDQAIGQRCIADKLAQFGRSWPGRFRVAPVGRVQYCHHLLPKPAAVDQSPIGFGGDRKPFRYLDAVTKTPCQFAKRRIFAADQIEVIKSNLVEPADKANIMLLRFQPAISRYSRRKRRFASRQGGTRNSVSIRNAPIRKQPDAAACSITL